MKINGTIIRIFYPLLFFTLMGCANNSSDKTNKSNSAKILLGFELGMPKTQFYDSLKLKLDKGIITDISKDYDKSRNLKRYLYSLQTVNTKIDLVFIIQERLFYKDKLMEFVCGPSLEGSADSLKLKYNDLVDLYMHKYTDYQYNYEIDNIFKQPIYKWSKDGVSIEITSILSALIKNGDNYKAIPISDYEQIKSDLYSLYVSISYTNDVLSNLKRMDERTEIENNERKKYQKADSLSKIL